MRIPSFVPEAFARTIVEVFDQDGVAWLERLPATLADCERRWSLAVAPPVPNLSYNYVAPAVRSAERSGPSATLPGQFEGSARLAASSAVPIGRGVGSISASAGSGAPPSRCACTRSSAANTYGSSGT